MSVAPAGPILSLCKDTSDVRELFNEHGLYLKPIARINICVQLPNLRETGKSVTNWEIIERLRLLIKPDSFQQIRVVKATIEFVRIQAELENRAIIEKVRHKLDGKCIKLSGFHENLKVRAAESKSKYPTRYDWEAFFRDNPEYDERKPGERPDTLHVSGLPIKWFASRFVPASRRTLPSETAKTDGTQATIASNQVASDNVSASQRGDETLKPSELIVRRVFTQFGTIRALEIPLLSVLNNIATGRRSALPAGYTAAVTFDVYVQFREYVSFDRAMNTFRDQKLVHTSTDGHVYSAFIQVDFDRTKYFSDQVVAARRNSRMRIVPKRGFGKFGPPEIGPTGARYNLNTNASRAGPRLMSETRRSILLEARAIRKMIEKRLERRILNEVGKRQRQLRTRFERTLVRRERKRKKLKQKAREEREKRRHTIQKRRLQAVRLLQFAFARLVSKVRDGQLQLTTEHDKENSRERAKEERARASHTRHKSESTRSTTRSKEAARVRSSFEECVKKVQQPRSLNLFTEASTATRGSALEERTSWAPRLRSYCVPAAFDRGETPRPAVRSCVQPVQPEPEGPEPHFAVRSAVRLPDQLDREARAARMQELRTRYLAMISAFSARRGSYNARSTMMYPESSYFYAYANCLRKYGVRYSQFAPTPLIRRPAWERDLPPQFDQAREKD